MESAEQVWYNLDTSEVSSCRFSSRRNSASMVDEYFLPANFEPTPPIPTLWDGFTQYYDNCEYPPPPLPPTPLPPPPPSSPNPVFQIPIIPEISPDKSPGLEVRAPGVQANKRGTRVHECKYPGCSKAYTTRSSLCVHRRIHSGRKPYVCQLSVGESVTCGKTFLTSSHLKVHQRVHSGERPYVCNTVGADGRMCVKAFVSSSHLHVHRQAHLGVKPYTCAFQFWDGTTCGQAFSYQHALRRHTKMHLRRALQGKLLAKGELEAVLRGDTSA